MQGVNKTCAACLLSCEAGPRVVCCAGMLRSVLSENGALVPGASSSLTLFEVLVVKMGGCCSVDVGRRRGIVVNSEV